MRFDGRRRIRENPTVRGFVRGGVLVSALTLRAAAAIGQDDVGQYERYQRGIAALEAKDSARAVPELEAAASVFRRDPDVLYTLAKAKALSCDPEGASPRFRARSPSAAAPTRMPIPPSRRSRIARRFARSFRGSSRTAAPWPTPERR
jgi:hypothetical protein